MSQYSDDWNNTDITELNSSRYKTDMTELNSSRHNTDVTELNSWRHNTDMTKLNNYGTMRIWLLTAQDQYNWAKRLMAPY